MSQPTPQQLAQQWLQYTHLDKLYGDLPGMAQALPAIFGLQPQRYAEITAGFDANARDAADRLLTNDQLAARVDALPFDPGQTVLAVGDSTTDDLQSWAEILRHLLALRRPGDGVRIVNGGLSAHTTAMVLRRWPAALAQRPDWVICLLGGNDVTRIGPAPTKPQVGLAESIANLIELRRIAADLTATSWVWMTPTPVLEDRVVEFPAFRSGQSTWHNADVLALADAIGRFDEPVVDLVAAFGVPPDGDLLGPDGVHPTLAGQAAIITALVQRLAAGRAALAWAPGAGRPNGPTA
jgi:lysophospholipase L1-like esterase